MKLTDVFNILCALIAVLLLICVIIIENMKLDLIFVGCQAIILLVQISVNMYIFNKNHINKYNDKSRNS